MSSISQCQYEKCSRSFECYRFLATPNPDYQAYNKFENICNERNSYKWFWQADESLIVKKEEIKENQEIQAEKTEKEVTENTNENIESVLNNT